MFHFLMRLRDYLSHTGEKSQNFADRIGVTRQTVWFWLVGKRYPSSTTMAKIVAVTNGQVTPNDFFTAPLHPGQSKPPINLNG